ncbi:hypothetical protein BDF22DRAFT_147712 [Syncephalis plumigaleata]|nr:hypothetical protein BDF22DRAFT_147712 [Syncephalis plumigaleata]
MAMFSFTMTSMARGTHGLRRRQTHRNSLLHIDDSSASTGPSAVSSSLTNSNSGNSASEGKVNQHLSHSLTKYATPGFTRYAIPIRSYMPHRRRRRPALIKPAARNATSEKLLKCRRMFSALHISCTPTGAGTTKRDTKLHRQQLKRQRRLEQRRLIRSLYSHRQQSKSLAAAAAAGYSRNESNRISFDCHHSITIHHTSITCYSICTYRHTSCQYTNRSRTFTYTDIVIYCQLICTNTIARLLPKNKNKHGSVVRIIGLTARCTPHGCSHTRCAKW